MEFVMKQQQEQRLLMTTQLRKSIELLQYSISDLEQFIRQQELENPLIELRDSSSAMKEKVLSIKRPRSTEQQPLDIVKPVEKNRRDYLIQMVQLNFQRDNEKKLLKYIIHHLNDYGYLNLDDAEIIYSSEELTNGIELLQQVGPLGIGARNLEECLLLQCKFRYPEHPILLELIQNHLPLLAEKKWKLLIKKLKCSEAQIQEANNLILTLNPKPCIFIQKESIEYVYPDIIVENFQDELIFYLNDSYLPIIELNSHYLNLPTINQTEKQYIHHHYKNYQWLIRSVEQRRETIKKIIQVLIKKQLPFFKKGLSELIPLTLKEVADAIEMSESTVSRVTSNKYIQTPAGTFKLKSLFTSKIDTEDGRSISQEKVKRLLTQIIEQENKYKPYSDQKIADYFVTEHAISIARRTISKYRDELNIPAANIRKQWL